MCTIIAEIGENHLGNMEIAFQLIDLSKDAGVDYVKFQHYDSANCSDTDPEKDWFKKVELDIAKLESLYKYTIKKGLKFLCTPWDAEKAEGLFSLGLIDMKIASFHITDHEMLELIDKKAEKVFLSTGMSTLQEIDAAVKMLGNVDLYILHCVSEYPLAENHANLKIMDLLKDRYNCKVGYSDHTMGIIAPLAAVARGAQVIEKHITLSKTSFGTDHILSADPIELKLLVEITRRTEEILGSREKRMTQEEANNQEFLRSRFSHNKS